MHTFKNFDYVYDFLTYDDKVIFFVQPKDINVFLDAILY